MSWFICSRKWCIDKLWIFYANQTSMCDMIHIWTKGVVGALLNRFKPSSKIFYWPFQGGAFLWIIYVISVLFCYAFMHVCLLMPGARADLLVLVCDVYLWRCHFPIGILGQVWYLIVSIPDLCPLSYFYQESKEYAINVRVYKLNLSTISCWFVRNMLIYAQNKQKKVLLRMAYNTKNTNLMS